MLITDTPSAERKFHVYKRERTGYVHRIAVVMANNKFQADTKVQMMYRRSLQIGSTVWAVDPEQELKAMTG